MVNLCTVALFLNTSPIMGCNSNERVVGDKQQAGEQCDYAFF